MFLDPRRGFPIARAMGWYGDQDVARRCGDLWLLGQMAGGEHRVRAELRLEAATLRRRLLDELMIRLRAGELVARGFRPGEATQTELPAEWWRGCAPTQIDLLENAVEAHGARFTGILVYPAAQKDPAVTTTVERATLLSAAGPLPPFDVKEARGIMVGLKVQKTLRPTEEAAVAMMKRHFAKAPRDRVREIVRQTWGEGKRGPRNSAK